LVHLFVQKILYEDRRSHRGYLDNRLDAPHSSHHAPPSTGNPLRIAPIENIAEKPEGAYVI
jgi:hypothetical protein